MTAFVLICSCLRLLTWKERCNDNILVVLINLTFDCLLWLFEHYCLAVGYWKASAMHAACTACKIIGWHCRCVPCLWQLEQWNDWTPKVPAPINCIAVGISVVLGFSLAMFYSSKLYTERNDFSFFFNPSPQMVSGRWLLWRMVWLQQRKAQSLNSSMHSSSKGRHIYWKTSSARYGLCMYLLCLFPYEKKLI